MQVSIELKFLDAIRGVKKILRFAKYVKCKTCNGTKLKPGTTYHNCDVCNGIGYRDHEEGNTLVAEVCTVCNGSGKIF